MSADDNSITLTTYRILQKTNTLNKEILLKDIIGHEVIKKHNNYYKGLLLLFGIPTVLLYLIYFLHPETYANASDTELQTILSMPTIITSVAATLFFTRLDRWIRITGRFNNIEFSIGKLGDSSVNKFLNRMTIESDNSKRAE